MIDRTTDEKPVPERQRDAEKKQAVPIPGRLCSNDEKESVGRRLPMPQKKIVRMIRPAATPQNVATNPGTM